MSANQKKNAGLVPKLRFPEFRDAGGWDADELGIVAEFVNEKIPVGRVSLDGYVSTESILPDFEGIAIASRLPATGSVTRFMANDTLVSNIRPYLKKVWYADKEGGASNDVIVIRAKRNLLPKYLSFLLKSDAFIDYVMTGAKGVKMPRGDIDSMKQYAALYPPTGEQQRIADCLTSLDDLIRLEAEKLDALKAHKKGLMQQLFPAEGETLPKLRFPEFRGVGESEINVLAEIVKFFSGGTPSKAEPTYWGGNIPWISASSMHKVIIEDADLRVTNEAIENGTRLAKKGCILILVRGSMLFKRVPICITIRDVAFNQDVKALTVAPDVVSMFLLYQLIALSPRIPINETGIGAGKIETEVLENLEIWIPEISEQQRIADCLSSLDTQITTQAEKIDTLKTHKKGLMQQLFPTLDEVRA